MILQRLVNYYDRLSIESATSRTLPKPGYSLQKVSFCVVLRSDGSFLELQSLADETNKKVVPQRLLVPGEGKPSGSGLNPCFLWDNAAYMLGLKADDEKPERTRECFQKFRERHLELEQEVNDNAFSAVCSFLKSWSQEIARVKARDFEKFTTHFGVFKIAGAVRYVHDEPKVVAFWAEHGVASDADASSSTRMCLVTGNVGHIARVHKPAIKGVSGSQSSGALLVSFNDKAYESFGKEQGDNSPVGIVAAFKYTNALNYLLSQWRRRIQLGDTTVVFWAERPALLEEVADMFFGDAPPPKPKAPAEDLERARQARLFLTQLRDGHGNGQALSPDADVGFYILGLSPNASRISIRFWVQSTVGEMQERLAQHLSDVELIGARPDDPPLIIRRIVQATGRAEFTGNTFKGYDVNAAPHLLSGAMARAVFQGTPYPRMLLTSLLSRLRADRHFGHERLAAVKAYLIRNSKKEMPVSLNIDHPSPAYHCGRLLCLLDYIQGQAIRNVNAGMVKKFYSVASAQPFAVFGRLIALTTKAHLPKLDSDDRPGFSQYCEGLLRQIISKIGDHFPRILNLDEQGEFALGFYNEKEELPDTPPRNFSMTARGERVRSKSEVTVADALRELGVNYEYERLLAVPGHRSMKPDFTVIGTTDRETVYIEYLGLSDNPDYMDRWKLKLEAFKAAGILPNEEGGGPSGRLVTFSETKTSGIDSAEIRRVLKKIFGLT